MRESLLTSAALLTLVIGFAHSYLGERYILIRLFRRENLPRLFGGTEFTRRTLRFAWHLTTVSWLGFGAILLILARDASSPRDVAVATSVVFLIHFFVVLWASRGRHLSWVIFLAIGILVLLAI